MAFDLGRLDRVRPVPDNGQSNDREPRRPAALEGHGVLDDGTSFGIFVVDRSYCGCQIETTLALLPGVKFRISVLGLEGPTEATVRWYKNGRAGLTLGSENVSQKAETPRKHPRLRVSAELSLRRMGRPQYRCRLFDLTPTGCKVEFVERPKPDEVLWIKFGDLSSIEATVRWVDGFYGGLEFARPIYPAVFELLLARLNH